jgi:hypothetical protein
MREHMPDGKVVDHGLGAEPTTPAEAHAAFGLSLGNTPCACA